MVHCVRPWCHLMQACCDWMKLQMQLDLRSNHRTTISRDLVTLVQHSRNGIQDDSIRWSSGSRNQVGSRGPRVQVVHWSRAKVVQGSKWSRGTGRVEVQVVQGSRWSRGPGVQVVWNGPWVQVLLRSRWSKDSGGPGVQVVQGSRWPIWSKGQQIQVVWLLGIKGPLGPEGSRHSQCPVTFSGA